MERLLLSVTALLMPENIPDMESKGLKKQEDISKQSFKTTTLW